MDSTIKVYDSESGGYKDKTMKDIWLEMQEKAVVGTDPSTVVDVDTFGWERLYAKDDFGKKVLIGMIRGVSTNSTPLGRSHGYIKDDIELFDIIMRKVYKIGPLTHWFKKMHFKYKIKYENLVNKYRSRKSIIKEFERIKQKGEQNG